LVFSVHFLKTYSTIFIGRKSIYSFTLHCSFALSGIELAYEHPLKVTVARVDRGSEGERLSRRRSTVHSNERLCHSTVDIADNDEILMINSLTLDDLDYRTFKENLDERPPLTFVMRSTRLSSDRLPSNDVTHMSSNGLDRSPAVSLTTVDMLRHVEQTFKQVALSNEQHVDKVIRELLVTERSYVQVSSSMSIRAEQRCSIESLV
jgi:hypothetical protein